MSMICWTILHHTAAPVVQGAGSATHAVRHAVGHIAHRVARAAHHTATVSGPSRTWAEVVCKFIPAAVAGGGLLIPAPANPPRMLDPPAPVTIVEPAPAISPWPIGSIESLGQTDPFWFMVRVGRYDPVETVPKVVPEPSSALVLLGGLGGLLLIQIMRMRSGRNG
jgi:hypothetical protein